MRRPGMACAAVALSALLGCAALYRLNATTYPLTGNSLMPAAQGFVYAKTDANGNTQLRVLVKHLAQPGRVSSGATAFVVWIHPEHEGSQNVGALAIDKNLDGELSTVTPRSRFELSITAEPSPIAERPTGPVVLRTAISGD